ncbi:MAG: hypothetical protein K0R66_1230 [Gammaproteobacteria bacterium]|jgi:hypothetical protein|nr:hypothetical protein [Gammaproteobacteria bacterium]
MKIINKTLVAAALSTSLLGGLAYADTSTYNPYINPAPSNAQAPSSSSPSQNATSVPASSVQPTNPSYNFSQRSTTTAPQPFLINTSPSSNTPAPSTLGPGGTQQNFGPGGGLQPLGPGGNQPSAPLGPGGTAPSPASSLLQAILNLDSDVKTTNKLQITQWNQNIQNQVQANAMLLPNNLDFLWNQTAYLNMQQLVPSSNSTSGIQQSIMSSYNSYCTSSQGGVSCQPRSAFDNPSNLMTAQNYTQSSQSILNQQGPATTPYLSTLNSLASNSNSASSLAAAAYAISNIAAMNQADSTDQIDSQMSVLNAAVSAPFSSTPDPTTNQTWFQQLSTASSPQLLRSVAIMLALNNYLQYQNLKAQQTSQLLQSSQLIEEVKLERAIQTLDSNEGSRQQTSLKSIQFMLQNMKH